MSLSLDDIARLAGVSRTTASRVINDHPDVSQSTRIRVQAVIAEQRFQPNPAARMLASQRTRIIGIGICSPSRTFRSDYGSIVLEAISQVANDRDYATLLYWEQSAIEKDRFAQRILQQNRLMDGMLMASTDIDSPLIDHLLEMGIPFVMMEKPTRHIHEISYVTIDNVASAQTAVEHLLRLGRKRIAHIGGLRHLVDAQDRLVGYRNALAEHDISFDPRLVLEEASYSRESGYEATKDLLLQGVPFDAIFVANDDGAVGALAALKEAGMHVPDDVAVVGFDNLPSSLNCTPQLTTMNQPIHEKSQRAMQLLLDTIEGKVTEPLQIILPTTLVVRHSCGANARERKPDLSEN